MIKKYVLDSYAALCYLQDEPGADIVFHLLEEASVYSNSKLISG